VRLVFLAAQQFSFNKRAGRYLSTKQARAWSDRHNFGRNVRCGVHLPPSRCSSRESAVENVSVGDTVCDYGRCSATGGGQSSGEPARPGAGHFIYKT